MCICGWPYAPCCLGKTSKCRTAEAPAVAAACLERIFNEAALRLFSPDERRRGRGRVAGTELDGRKRNRGLDGRTHRSWWFKKRVIEEAERLESSNPSQGSWMAAQIFDVNRDHAGELLEAAEAAHLRPGSLKDPPES